jgi:hypothetical protein
MAEGSLIVPSHVAQARRAQLADQQPRKGLGRAIHDRDPAKVIYDRLGIKKASDPIVDPQNGKPFRLFGNRVLVGIYERPDKMDAGGGKSLYISDQTRHEDEHQGKAALVLMMGHSCFVSDSTFDFGPDQIKLGEWISLWVTDGRKIVINGQMCRVVRDQDINMVIPAPDIVY